MLQSIREKTSGWIAYVIIGLISIPFALWGVNSYLGGGAQQPAAVVDGTEITARQLDYAYARYRERLRSVFGGTLPAAFDDENALKEQVLTQIIEERVLLNYVQEQGFRIGDKKLFEAIQNMSSFQLDGKFDKEVYRNQLASQGYAPTQFEQEIRQSQEMGQLNQAIRATAFTLPSQAETYNNLQNQSRKLRTLTIANQQDSVEVTEQEIVDFYNQQSNLYLTPEQVKVNYIEVNLDKVKDNVVVTEDQALERYEQMADQLTTAEIRTASHILITVSTDATSDETEQAKQKITDLQARLQRGEDFASLAREFSQDPGSAAEGGALGEVERGMMVKPFESALFALQPGEVSEPVKTRFGWHLIKLHDIMGGETQSFTDARKSIEEELARELAESQIYDLVESLSNIGYEQPDSLLPASEQLGLAIETTDWFTRSQGSGVANQQKVRQAAFSDDVLKLNRNSETIELSESRVVILHLNAHKPSQKQPLEEVRASVEDSLKRKKGRELALEQGKELLAKVQAGDAFDTIAEQASLVMFDAGYITRDIASIDVDVVNAAFTLPRPQNDQPVFEGVSESDGDYTLIELSEIRVETDENAEAAQQQVINTLTGAQADYAFQAMVKTLAEEASIIRTPVEELQ